MRTPLTALRLQVQRLLRNEPIFTGLSPQDNENIVSRIDRQVDRLVAMVDSLLDLSKLQADRLPIVVAEGDLVASVQQTLERCAPLAERAACALSLDVTAVVTAAFDGARLEQVLSNLIANATKFGAGKPIDVAVFTRNGRGVITVRDHGIGIQPADQTRIFERFERAVSSRNFGGLGLGLWISRRLVQRMGGGLEVSSRPGEGATFTVDLPSTAAERAGVAS
ncbi:MAG TPA: HAMP domain-containing sensor histidine kinase [Polyangia bacterium]|nr:HAMP domain-containing sensor histidine kinase [Polyangia bacterium]